MKVLGLEWDLAWEDPEANAAVVASALPWIAAQQPDLVVLPEMWSTGFSMSPSTLNVEAQIQAQHAMVHWSKDTNAAWFGSLIARDGDGAFKNRGHFVLPDGTPTTFYDKRHLFTFGQEPQHYARGHERVVVSWRGWRILLQICYDLRFPVFSRNQTGEGGWDLALYVANWPAARGQAWSTLLSARAIENCGWVCGVNRCGRDGLGVLHDGRSAIRGPRGEDISIATSEVRDNIRFVIADLDLDDLNAYRQKFPALQDADDFTLHL